jgi:uncharacterized membrane protein YccC
VSEGRLREPRFLEDLFRRTPHRLDLPLGIAAAGLLLAPLLVDQLFGLGTAGVLVTFGVLNLFFGTLPRPQQTRPRLAAAGILTNTIGFFAGSLIVRQPLPIELALTATGATVALLAGRNPRWENLGGMAAVMLVVGIGLPAPSLDAVPERVLEVALGGGIGFAGWAALTRWLPPLPEPAPTTDAPPPERKVPLRTVLPYAVIVGLAVAAGLWTGLALGLARDYWIMLTVVVAFRAEFASTLAFATARVVGTVSGAVAAFFLTQYTSGPEVLLPVLFLSAALTIATRAVNYTLYAACVALFVIGLLNLLYSGGPGFALVRIVDTLIGGALTLVAALALHLTVHRPRTRTAAPA